MHHRTISALALGLLAGVAQADPTATIMSSTVPGLTFEEYSGSTPVGAGAVDTNVLYFIDEQSGPLGKSWYIFYEPRMSESVSATITFTFDGMITSILTSQADLDATNAAYGAPGITYTTATLIGLEVRSDVATFAGNVLTINLRAQTPGDHIRIFTAVASVVPEPATYTLLAAGLLAAGFVARRRKR